MGLPDLVLVHGGEHAGDCWDLTTDALRRYAPELRVLAVDLPGRRNKPGDLASATISNWEESVVTDIEAAGLKDFVITGHSMAGVIVPGVVSRLGSARVKEMVLISAFVPRQGQAIVDTLSGPLGVFARGYARSGRPRKVPQIAARYAFCNGMTANQRAFALSRLFPESVRIVAEPADRSNLPPEIPRTWVLTTHDRALSVRSQRASIAALGGVNVEVAVPACHDVMISHPDTLAHILLSRCRVYDQ